MTREQIAALVAALVLAVLVGAVGTLAVQEASAPDCPYEDSCISSWRDGSWHLDEAHP